MPKTKGFITEQFKGWRPGEAIWLFFCLVSVTILSSLSGDPPLYVACALSGVMYTVLAGKGKPSCFIFGLANTPIYAWIAFKAGYYGDFALNLYYFAVMIPGLLAWLKNRSDDAQEGIKRTCLSIRGRVRLAAICLLSTALLWYVLSMLGGRHPLHDSVTNVLSIAAMVLTVRRAIEEWVLWIIVNAVEVFMWYSAWRAGTHPLSILLMWTLFLANGIYLFGLWIGIERKNRLKTASSRHLREECIP